MFREELRTQKLKVAKHGKQNLEITETRQELKDSSIMVHAKDVETQKFGTQLLKDVTRDFASTEMIWQKNLRRTSMIGRSHRSHEQDLKSLATLKTYWPLEDQTPVIPMLDATFVSCHLFDVFPTATNKIFLFKTIVCIVCIPLYLSYLTPNPWTQ